MRKRKICYLAISLIILCSLVLNLTGCAATIKATDLTSGVTPKEITALKELENSNSDSTDFAIRLFKATNESGKNTLISPLSVLCALSMTTNGADGQTLGQMETVLGMSTDELNPYLYSYINSLPQGDKYKLNVANSIWFTDKEPFTVNKDFLQINADYYGADIYKSPFNNQTVSDINNWVKNKTDGMIPKVIDNISDDAVMFLVNALAFDAEWDNVYKETQISNGKFTKEDGTKQDAEMMYCTENKYLEDEKATGFIKYYKDRKYAFVALLPNENVSVNEYINSLDGASLNALLKSAENSIVETAIPKFKTEYETRMSVPLINMGISDAFNPDLADFSKLGISSTDNVFINEVIHKTFIQVDETGTKAGAVTVVEMNGATALPPNEIKQVYLDRPFIYMLIDCENNVPFFIGTMMDVNA